LVEDKGSTPWADQDRPDGVPRSWRFRNRRRCASSLQEYYRR